MILKFLLNTRIIWYLYNYWRIQSEQKRKILIVFGYVITDMLSSKNLKPIVPELIVRGRKLNIPMVFITQSYFPVPKNTRLNSTS